MLSTRYVYLPQRLEEACYVTSGYGIEFFSWLSRALAEAGMVGLRGSDEMGSWWAGTGRVRVKIDNNVHGHLRSHNLGKRIMRCSFLAHRLVVCLERVTTATIKQYEGNLLLENIPTASKTHDLEYKSTGKSIILTQKATISDPLDQANELLHVTTSLLPNW
jgi:hypothetical protein